MKHFASPRFWRCYHKLLPDIRQLADKKFDMLKENPTHPSLHFKKIGRFRSVRVGIKYRSLAVESRKGLVWFWIGKHTDYERFIKGG